MAMVPTTGDNPVGRASPRHEEYHSRQGVQDMAVLSRVDAGEIHLSQRSWAHAQWMYLPPDSTISWRYVSWPADPFAIVTNAFSLEWQGEIGYAFPPFALIGRCLQKMYKRCIKRSVQWFW